MQTLNIREVGLAQRLLMWGVLAGIFGLVPVLLIVIWPFHLYCYWRITSALQIETGAKIFCMLLMLVPLVNLITLLIFNGKATRALRGAGIKVGLMGPKIADLPAV
jgi:O-antigen ligase